MSEREGLTIGRVEFTGPGQHRFDSTSIEIDHRLVAAMKQIARGRTDNGRPLGTEDTRQLMRRALTECGMDW